MLFGVVMLPLRAETAGLREETRFSGGKVNWTRLISGSLYWNRHASADGRLLHYIRRNTPLDVEEMWQATDPADLSALCAYPFVYADNLHFLADEKTGNLAEYLKRGGFLFVDFCGNVRINPRPEAFLAQQVAALSRHLPDLRVAPIPGDHDVFGIFFKLDRQPQTRPGDSAWLDGETNPMFGLYLGARMIGMVALSGYQCGWAGSGTDVNAIECMQMVTNIYLYAMSR